MASAEEGERQAPEGTYQRFAELGNDRLGNAYTKRRIEASEIHPPNSDESLIVVNLRIKHGRSYLDGETIYSLSLNRQDRIVAAEARLYRPSTAFEPQPAEPLTLAQFLKEVRTAERIQPTLRR